MKNKTVVIGLSGGVDSAVSAYLLKQQGYNVIAVFMQNWDSVINNETNYSSEFDVCDAQIDYDVAQKIAKHLDIPLHRVEFIKEYWDYVFQYFINEYNNGNTPNPDVLCNKYIKFDAFLKYAFENFHCDYIATGHYAKITKKDDQYCLSLCKDENKDQTYFLCEINKNYLSKIIFPLSNLLKQEVREIAKQINLPNFDRKDSTGICFIGERNFRNFLQNYIPNQPGKIIDITNNNIVGEHQGVMYYTIGQRKGLNLGGLSEKYFVCKKDINNKIIYVAPNSLEDIYLQSNCCEIRTFNWLYTPKHFNNIKARFRHRQKLQDVNIEITNGILYVNYEAQKNIVAGQFCVLYQENICLGGGPIFKVFKKN